MYLEASLVVLATHTVYRNKNICAARTKQWFHPKL